VPQTDDDLSPILPRSLHRPVAVTEGSATRNLNEIGVRLWTDRSVDQDRELNRNRTQPTFVDDEVRTPPGLQIAARAETIPPWNARRSR
jgi:hypothetical protein